MLKSIRPLPVEFIFAGFSFPRYVTDLPTVVPRYTYGDSAAEMLRIKLSTLANVLRQRRAGHAVCGPYYVSPAPNSKARGIGFYARDEAGTLMMGDGGIALRVEYTDAEYSTPDGDTTFYGIVARLPKSRGFLAGWTMGPGMASSLDCKAFDSLRDAQTAADCLSESAVWEEAQHQAANEQAEALRFEIDSLIDQIRTDREMFTLAILARNLSKNDTVTAKRSNLAKSLRVHVRTNVDLVRVLRERYNDNFARLGY